MVKKEEEKGEKKKVAKSPFILALIGGILGVLLGMLSFFSFSYNASLIINQPELFLNTTALGGQELTLVELAQAANFFSMLAWIFLAFFLIVGVLSIISAVLMKKEKTMKKGGIMGLIVGILSINILVIIAGGLGIAFSSKKK